MLEESEEDKREPRRPAHSGGTNGSRPTSTLHGPGGNAAVVRIGHACTPPASLVDAGAHAFRQGHRQLLLLLRLATTSLARGDVGAAPLPYQSGVAAQPPAHSHTPFAVDIGPTHRCCVRVIVMYQEYTAGTASSVYTLELRAGTVCVEGVECGVNLRRPTLARPQAQRCRGMLCGRMASVLVLSSRTVPRGQARLLTATCACKMPHQAARSTRPHKPAPRNTKPCLMGVSRPRQFCSTDGPRATRLGCERHAKPLTRCTDATSSSCRSQRVLCPCGRDVAAALRLTGFWIKRSEKDPHVVCS